MSTTIEVPVRLQNKVTPAGFNLSGIFAEMRFYFEIQADIVDRFRKEKSKERIQFEELDDEARWSTTLGGHKIAGYRDHYLSSNSFTERAKNKNRYLIHSLVNDLQCGLANDMLRTMFLYLNGKGDGQSAVYFAILNLKFFKELLCRMTVEMEKSDYNPDDETLSVIDGCYLIYSNLFSIFPVRKEWQIHFRNACPARISPDEAVSWAKSTKEKISRSEEQLLFGFIPMFGLMPGVQSVVRSDLAPLYESLLLVILHDYNWQTIEKYMPAFCRVIEAVKMTRDAKK